MTRREKEIARLEKRLAELKAQEQEKPQRPRRDPGEGTVYYHEGRERWIAQLVLPNGKRKTAYHEKRQEARDALNTWRREVDAGLHDSTQAETSLSVYSGSYLARNRERLRANSYRLYESYVRSHFDGIGHLPLNKITSALLRDHYDRLTASGLGASSVNDIHKFIHIVLEDAVNVDILPKNPARKGLAPPVPERDYVTLTIEQVNTLLDAARGHQYEAAIVLAFAAGLREGEICGLRWSDIDWQRRRISINTKLIRLNRQYTLEPPKSASSKTTIQIPGYVLECLRSRQAIQEEDREEVGRAWENQWNLVFTNPVGRPISSFTLLRNLFRLLKSAGLPRIRLHDLRHTYATLMIQEGVPLNVVSTFLRHSSVAVTSRTYVHVTPKMNDDAMGTITAMLPANFIDTTREGA